MTLMSNGNENSSIDGADIKIASDAPPVSSSEPTESLTSMVEAALKSEQPAFKMPKFDKLVAHDFPHVDECGGIAVGLIHSSPFAKVVFVKSDAELKQFVGDNKVALIGTGKGLIPGPADFDEHRPEGRRPNTSAALLVAEALGVAHRPDHVELLAEVLRADTEPGQEYMGLGNVVKTLHSYSKRDSKWVVQLVYKIFKARLHQLSEGATPRPLGDFTVAPETPAVAGSLEDNRKSIATMLAVPAISPPSVYYIAWHVRTYGDRRWRWLSERTESGLKLKPPQIVLVETEEQMQELAKRHDVIYVGMNGGQFPKGMEVSEVLRYLGMTETLDENAFKEVDKMSREVGKTQNPAYKWRALDFGAVAETLIRYSKFKAEHLFDLFGTIFGSYRRKSVELHHLCREGASKATDFGAKATVRGREERLNAVYVESDLESMALHFRLYHNVPITVVRKPLGNTAIFCGHDHAPAAAFIGRYLLKAECEMVGFTPEQIAETLSEYELIATSGEGEFPGSFDHWYLFGKAGITMNGSLTHQARPTRLSQKQIIHAVKNGLVDYLKS